jgi:hypothetical protein
MHKNSVNDFEAFLAFNRGADGLKEEYKYADSENNRSEETRGGGG